MTDPPATPPATPPGAGRTRREVLLGAGAAAVALVVAACGGKKGSSSSTTTAGAAPSSGAPTSAAATTTAAPAPGDTYPLTGLAVDDAARRARPVLAVKIDNAPSARPQSGLDKADVVVEEVVEGGVVRFCALFHSKDADPLGPVRSVRAEDATLVTPLHGYFAYSGGNDIFKGLIRQAPVVLVGFDELSAAYRRRKDRQAPYNLYSATPTIYRLAPSRPGLAPPPALFTYRQPSQPLAGGAAPASGLSVHLGDRTDADWAYDAASGRWMRTTNGTPHVVEGGGQLGFANVVLQFVTYRDTAVRDASGTISPEAILVGEGVAWVLSGPALVKGRWRRASAGAVTELLDAAGSPIGLLPGTTWLSLPPVGAATRVR